MVAATTTERRPSMIGVGTVVWLASELMFFSGLFAAYFSLRAADHPWPPHGVELSTGRAALATLVLLASSGTMHLAVTAAGRHDRRGAVRWLLVTLLLGGAFIANLAVEWATANFSISSSAYGSIFYLLTGFHGLHVIGGLVFMVVVMGVIGGGESRAPAHRVVDVCAYYWHFVDVVWLGVFATVYLIR